MNYQNWAWLDDATNKQREDTQNEAAIVRLCREAASLYNSIPEPGDERTMEALDNALDHADSDEHAEQIKAQFANRNKSSWGTLDAIEEMMAARGARFMRPYEHHNENERAMEYAESNQYPYEPSDY